MTTTLSSTEVAVASIKAMESLDPERHRSVTHPEAVNREAANEPLDCRVPGPDGFLATAKWLHGFASDINWEVENAIAEGDLVAVQTTMRGTQSGPFTVHGPDGSVVAAMPSQGRGFVTRQTHWFRVRDGLVVEHWADRDDLGMGTQLGWFGPPA
ncbi:ester cyclase [Pseudonocardia sp. CA-107938]|uniref:ester cyclase n=1 Tax=Pseudonocardia sp. CA-107938 TaxID=3240021 RepID=UPI003D911BE4